MVYVVLMPVKRDNIRRTVIVHAEGFQDVQELLALPIGWLSWVSCMDSEIEELLKQENTSISKILSRR